MDDDPVEPAEQSPPEILPVSGPSRQQVVSGEHGRAAWAKERNVELGRRQPLDVQDVAGDACQPRKADRVLGRLQRQAQPGAAKEPRRGGVEDLAAEVSSLRGSRSEPELRGDELDLRALPGQPGRELVVVLRRERGWVGEDDAHGARTVVASC